MNTDRLNWYIGFGAHVGFRNGNNVQWGNSETTYTVLGIDRILGLEYVFKEVPINLGTDRKPALNFVGY